MMENTILIVGAGNFGAASALELAKSSENVRIILVDTTPAGNPRAASHDINKIIRDDYPDTLYMRMMLKAMKLWRSSPLYKPFFHEVGMLRADTTGFSNDSMKAYNELGAITRAEWLTVQEVRARWNGCFATTDFDGLGRIMYNPGCGWAEADKALNVTIQAAIDNGVEYEVGEVTKLIIEGGSCLGVQLRDGRDIMADSVLLCAGARTAVLLADSAPNDPALQAGTRVLATGAVSFYGTLEGAMKEKFTDVPVLKSCLEKVKGESMSMTPSGIVKFNCDMCFTNFVKHEKTGQEMSIPPQESHYATWTKDHFPQYLKDRCMNTMKGLYGDDAYNIKIEEYRMCWDATTPSHDFLICPHPSCKGLYIATGGSFHGWKFLPVLGEYIVKMIRGTLDQDYTDRWAWDKKRDDGKRANPTYQIEGDLKDWT